MGTRPKDMFKKYNKKSKSEPKYVSFKSSRKSRGTLANPRPYGKITPEKKNIDQQLTGQITFAQTTATVAVLNVPCIEGTAPTQHVGRKIMMSSLTYKLNVAPPAAQAEASSVRLLIVYDRQTNGALPATTQIMQTDQLTGLMNLANSKRFVIICDELIPCVGNGGPEKYMITGYRKINLVTEFNETNGGTIADIQTGGIYSLIWAPSYTVASPPCGLATRIRFTDV